MGVTVDLPRRWCERLGLEHIVDLPAGTILQTIDRLRSVAPPLQDLAAPDPENPHSVRLFLNHRLLRRPADFHQTIGSGDRLLVALPPHAAGPLPPGALTPEEKARYARHIALPEVGEEGQRRLKDSSVAIVGVGGLGSPLAIYLAAAGMGRLGLIDPDTVDPADLHRQVLYGTADLGRPKIEAARERLRDLNPDLEIVGHGEDLSPRNAIEILREYDVVCDATDNFPSRYLINDACVLLGRPNVFGSVFRFEGQVTVFGRHPGPCYRCLFPEPPPPGMVPTCVEGGVLGILPGVIGLLQATEAVKLLVGLPRILIDRLVVYDAIKMRFRDLRVQRDPTCPACGDNPAISSLSEHEGAYTASPSAPRAAPKV